MQGYFINNDNEKINCYIKDVDARNNPKGFEYTLEAKGKIYKAGISSIKEFGIESTKKYIRFTGKIDRTGILVDNLSFNRNPEWSNEILFLKVLVEGEGSLYSYNEGNIHRYFYKSGDQPIEQLVYKQYKINEATIRENNYFQQQLYANVRVQGMTQNDYERMNYQESELAGYFIKFNKSKGVPIVSFETQKERESFNLKVAAGIGFSNFKAQNNLLDKVLTFSPAFSFSIGLEAEYIMPFRKNRISLFLNPSYNYNKTEETVTEVFLAIENTFLYKLDYISIDVPVGIRYYVFLKEKSKIFFDLGFVNNLQLNSEITRNSSKYLDISNAINFRGGAGFAFKRYFFELNFDYDRNLLGSYNYWNSGFNYLSLVFKYQL